MKFFVFYADEFLKLRLHFNVKILLILYFMLFFFEFFPANSFAENLDTSSAEDYKSVCLSGTAFEQLGCLTPQVDEELRIEESLMRQLKVMRKDVADQMDRFITESTRYRENYCVMIANLEDGDSIWRSVWFKTCELKELKKFNSILLKYTH